MEILEKIKQEIEIFDKKRKVLLEELRAEFPKMFTELFNKSKIIESIGWKQYTVYFADGDECTFSVYQDEIDVNEEYEDDLEWYDWRIKYYLKGDNQYKNILEKNPNLNIEDYKILQEFKEVLQSIPKDFYKDLFGDHKQITIYKDGTINVEEYTNHD